MHSRHVPSNISVHPNITLVIHKRTSRLKKEVAQIVYSIYIPFTTRVCGPHGQFPILYVGRGANSWCLHMALSGMPDSLESGQWSTVSCFWDVPKDSGEEKSFHGTEHCKWHLLFLWFRKRNVFQERVYIDECTVAHGLVTWSWTSMEYNFSIG